MANEADRAANRVAEALKEHGFKKRRRTWSRDLPDTVQVFNLHASEWSQDEFYVNVGKYINALGNLTIPSEYKCHVRQRVPHDDVSTMTEYSLAWLDKRRTDSDLRDQTIGGDPHASSDGHHLNNRGRK